MARFAVKQTKKLEIAQDTYEHGYNFPIDSYRYIAKPGLSQQLVEEISAIKGEPKWMLEERLKGLEEFGKRQMPDWGADLSAIDFSKYRYYLRPSEQSVESWEQVPPEVKVTFERLGIPEAERAMLAGVKAQYDSEVVYGAVKQVWEKAGVVFLSMDEALKQHPDLVREYFTRVIPTADNKFAALNTAVWSGGSFVYVPPKVEVSMPLQTYFRINAENMGQFERTLIIVGEGAKVHYIEGCTAPAYSSGSLHAAVVEIWIKPGGRCQYTTVQNWYRNIYNLVTKRAWVEEEGEMVWTDFNMGSKVTMKYPSFVLAGRGARGETLSMAMAGKGQHQDTGSKAIHLAPHTSSMIMSKSISKDGGRTSYRGLVHMGPKATNAKNVVVCDALLLDPESRSDTYPIERILNSQVEVQHEASVSKIGEEQLFYLMSRGINEEEARKMVVNGFIDDLVRKLPLEYAVEMNRLIDHEMEGSIG